MLEKSQFFISTYHYISESLINILNNHFTELETLVAIDQSKGNRSAGVDGIPAEVFMLNLKHQVCNVCEHEAIEDEFHFLIQCPLYQEERTI